MREHFTSAAAVKIKTGISWKLVMGIEGFHTNTKHYLSEVHIRNYNGQRVGCDASAWLHRGASPHSWALWHGHAPWNDRNEDPPWVSYPMNMIKLLRDNGVEPVLVFDGCRNPAKEPTSHIRAKRREKAKQRADAALSSNNDNEARRAIMQTVEVTPQMAYDLIQRLRIAQVQFIVAPYEADSQLAYLATLPQEQGGVSAVLTEDSDLIAYGCNTVVFKCFVNTEGNAQEMRLDQMLSINLNNTNNNTTTEVIDLTDPNETSAPTTATTSRKPTGGKNVSFYQWTQEMVLATCILSGCDFLTSLHGIGFKTAHGLVAKGRTLEGTFRHMRTIDRWTNVLTQEYEILAKKARESFLYALVYDPNTGKTTRLRELPDTLRARPEEELRHIGPDIEETIMHQIAHGDLNPLTMQPHDLRLPLPFPRSEGPRRWSVQMHPPAPHNGNIISHVGQFVNSPAASGGSERGAAAALQRAMSGITTAANNSSQQVAPDASQSSPLEVQVQDLMEMYLPSTTAAVNATTAAQPQTLPRLAGASGAPPASGADINVAATNRNPTNNWHYPTTNNNAVSRPGHSRFFPASLAPAAAPQAKGSTNPFVVRAPLQPVPRQIPQQQQQQNQKQILAKAMVVPPSEQQEPQQKQKQRLPQWFRSNNKNASQESVSLGSLMNQGNNTTSSLGGPTNSLQQQKQKTETKKKELPVAKAPPLLPLRGAPRAPESHPSVSLDGLFSTSNITIKNKVEILARSVFFNVSEKTDSAVGGDGGGIDQQEVTSPLKAPRDTNPDGRPMVTAPLPVPQPIGNQSQHHRSQVQQHQQQRAQQHSNNTRLTAWNVRKPTMSSFNSFGGRSASGNSSAGGSQSTTGSNKRKSGDSGGGRPSKKAAAMNAAAKDCARISTFFAPKKSE